MSSRMVPGKNGIPSPEFAITGNSAKTNEKLPSNSLRRLEYTPEQLLKEIETLSQELGARTEENILLNEVISTVGSTIKLDEVLSHVVDTITRATSCHAAFIYLYDSEKEQLVLASSSEPYTHHIGKISMDLGEGIAGWVGLHRQQVVIREGSLDDPRFRPYPELEEEKFQSLLSVPILTKGRRLIGVITVHTIAPYEFTEQHQTFAINTAALVGGAIENAQLYENTQRKLNILTSLSMLSQTITSGLYLDDMLRSLSTLATQIMEADLCVIMLLDATRGRLTVRATSPQLGERALSFQPVDLDHQSWEKLRNAAPQEMSRQALEHFNPLKDSHYKSLLSAPLISGTEQLGLLNCYSRQTRRYTSEDSTLLTTIANQIAVAIKNSHLVDMLAQKNLVKGFFEDLQYGNYDSEDALRQRANFLGCDLSRVHTVAMIEISYLEDEDNPGEALSEEDRLAIHKRVSAQVRRRILDTYPGSLLYEQENLLTSIICLSKDPTATRLKNWLRDLTRQMRSEHNICLSIGIGNPCSGASDYRRGFGEAIEAQQMGQHLNRGGGVTHFNDLGVYRYLYKIARMDDLRDMYQEQVGHIASYDRRKGTDLLDTLETYLECAGNLTRTSNRLFVHRNTLIQRLDRLQLLCKDIDLQERSNWLTLQVAIKVFKLRNSNT
ncbi:MAG TPA: GAF domain-containing protein [Ktedonobacteraceae bacterium]|nr:GAF domain-containing protein [Ktedonobacteraceae bacterium]